MMLGGTGWKSRGRMTCGSDAIRRSQADPVTCAMAALMLMRFLAVAPRSGAG